MSCASCHNPEHEHTGVLTTEPIPPRYLIRLLVGDYCFCYDARGLQDWIDQEVKANRLPRDPQNPSWVYDPYQMHLIKLASKGKLAQAQRRSSAAVQRIREELVQQGFRNIPDHAPTWSDYARRAYKAARPVVSEAMSEAMRRGRNAANTAREVGVPMARSAGRYLATQGASAAKSLVARLRRYLNDQMDVDAGMAMNAQEEAELERELDEMEAAMGNQEDVAQVQAQLDACKARSSTLESEAVALRQEIARVRQQLQQCQNSNVQQPAQRQHNSAGVLDMIGVLMESAFEHANSLVANQNFQVQKARRFAQALSQAIGALPPHPEDNRDALNMPLDTRQSIRAAFGAMLDEAQMRVFRLRDFVPSPSEADAFEAALISSGKKMEGILNNQ